MDTPRRWQIASSVTAVAGLGIGAILLGRPSTEPAATIDLDTVVTAESRDESPQPVERTLEIVRPRVIEDDPAAIDPATPVTQVSAASLASPDAASSPDTVDRGSSVDSD